MKPVLGALSILLLISSSWAAPQESAGNLDSLISDVFGTPNKETNRQVQPVPSSTSLDDLINNVFTTPANKVINPNSNFDEGCECVPYYLCHNGTIINNGVSLIDIRLNQCTESLEVCCSRPNTIPADQVVTPAPRPSTSKGCGHRNPEGVGFRITGQKDNEAQFGEFPWMVAILKETLIKDQKLTVYQCGGALIHPQVVLTAAHCVSGKQPPNLKVRAGEWDTQTKNEILPHQDRDVQTIITHEKFHSGALYNDVALLILSSPFKIADNVRVVCLPEADTVFDHSRCFASGWGKDVFGKEGHYQVILKRVELPVVPHDACQNSLRSTRLGSYFKLDRSFICAGGEPGRDTCKGDGGSPLVCPIKNDPQRYTQAGIVAWGIGCGENLIPGVYANVAFERPWIDQKMALYNFDINEYQYTSF